MMEGLQPNPQLKELFIEGYGAKEFPSWMMNDDHELASRLPNLIEIEIGSCSECNVLPPFSQLPSLKYLKLYDMEISMDFKESPSTTLILFPSLESLWLNNMSKLKELWRMDLLAEQGSSFPCLSELYIDECYDLASLHLPPSLSKLEINDCNKLATLELPSSSSLSKLEIRNCSNLESLELPSSSSLSKLEIGNCSNLASLKLPSSSSLSKLEIGNCSNLASLKLPSSSSLSELEINDCSNLASLELPSFHALSKLKIEDCPNLASINVASLTRLQELRLRNVGAELLRQLMLAFSSLKLLYIWGIDGEISVPEEQLPHVSTLESLYIWNCSGLETLLHWLSCLSSLRALAICGCPELTSLPKEIYSLQKLETLYLSGFELTNEDRAKIARLITDEFAEFMV